MLSATKVNNATKRPKPYKITDGQGLHLLVTPSGGKLWRFKYRFDGKYKGLAFGRYPDVSLAAARDARNEARKQIAAGIDPSQVKKALKAAGIAATESSFEVVAREWVQKNLSVWSPVHAAGQIDLLKRHIFPHLGERPIGEIRAPELLKVLRLIESTGKLATVHKVKGI